MRVEFVQMKKVISDSWFELPSTDIEPVFNRHTFNGYVLPRHNDIVTFNGDRYNVVVCGFIMATKNQADDYIRVILKKLLDN